MGAAYRRRRGMFCECSGSERIGVSEEILHFVQNDKEGQDERL